MCSGVTWVRVPSGAFMVLLGKEDDDDGIGIEEMTIENEDGEEIFVGYKATHR